jgi:hypothetical protein
MTRLLAAIGTALFYPCFVLGCVVIAVGLISYTGSTMLVGLAAFSAWAGITRYREAT